MDEQLLGMIKTQSHLKRALSEIDKMIATRVRELYPPKEFTVRTSPSTDGPLKTVHRGDFKSCIVIAKAHVRGLYGELTEAVNTIGDHHPYPWCAIAYPHKNGYGKWCAVVSPVRPAVPELGKPERTR